MSQPSEAPTPDAPKSVMQRILDVVERVGNKVPHPVVIFLILIAIVIVLSAILGLAGVGVTYEGIVPGQKADAAITTDATDYESGTGVTTHQANDEKKVKTRKRTQVGPELLTVE